MPGDSKPSPDALKAVIRQLENEAADGGYGMVAHLLGAAAEAVAADGERSVEPTVEVGPREGNVLAFPGTDRKRVDS